MKQKKNMFLIFISIFLSLFIANSAYGCKYKGEIDQCIGANDSGTVKSITDFVCISSTRENITFQVIVDLEFKELDGKMDEYLEDLENNKNYYFGKDRKKTFIDGLNDIESKRKYFKQQYNKLCGQNIVKIAGSCMPDEVVSEETAREYFKTTDCNSLVDTKLYIFDEVAYSILLLNKKHVRTDEKKIYDQAERANYDLVLGLMKVNLAYLDRILKKWNLKLNNTL